MAFCSNCGTEVNDTQAVCLKCGCAVVKPGNPNSLGNDLKNGKRNKWVALALAWLFGGLGAHKFYLGQFGLGVVYLLFFWTGIPYVIAIIEGVIYLTMSDQEFAAKYK